MCLAFTLSINLPLTSQMVIAAEKPLEIEQSGMQPPIQVGRPIPSWWDVKIAGTGLLEGRFEFQLKSDGQLIGTLQTEELALSGPQQRIRVLLPPVNDENTVDQLQVDIKFLGKRLTQNLGQHILRVAISRSRTFMVLTSTSRLAPRRSAERDHIVRRLTFESLVAELNEAVKTVYVPLEPPDLPQEPMAYCAYELVVLFADEFRALKKPQLEALAAWVRAGGSLYLEPTGVLEPFHVDFLRSIVAFGPAGIVIQPGSDGRLVPGTILNDERLLRIRNSLGRVVLRVDDQLAESVDTAAWREAVAYLWRMHDDQVAILGWQPNATLAALMINRPAVDAMGNYTDPGSLAARMSLVLPISTNELLDLLKPAGVRMVPLWVLGLILCSFVIWIGPVEYFGLGRLRARKFTWLTFPVATLLVTGLTVGITDQYMSTAEARRGLVIRDIGDDGATVRSNRFELLFLSTSRRVTTQIRKGVFSPLTQRAWISDDPYIQKYGGDDSRGGPRLDRVSTSLSGRIPTEFTATQQLAKWTPQLNRHFWLPGVADEVPIDWQALTADISPLTLTSNPDAIQTLLARVRQQFGPTWFVTWIGPHGNIALHQNGNWTALHSTPVQYAGRGWGDENHRASLPPSIRQQPALVRWLYQTSVVVSHGLFTLTSQVGPAGGAGLDDLPMFDPADPNQGLLIVIVPRGDDYIAYRKILRTGN